MASNLNAKYKKRRTACSSRSREHWCQELGILRRTQLRNNKHIITGDELHPYKGSAWNWTLEPPVTAVAASSTGLPNLPLAATTKAVSKVARRLGLPGPPSKVSPKNYLENLSTRYIYRWLFSLSETLSGLH